MITGPIDGAAVCNCGCEREPDRCSTYQASRSTLDKGRWSLGYDKWAGKTWINETERHCGACRRRFKAKTANGRPKEYCSTKCQRTRNNNIRKMRRNNEYPAAPTEYRESGIRAPVSPDVQVFFVALAEVGGSALAGYHVGYPLPDH